MSLKPSRLFRDEGIDVVTGAHIGGVEGKSGQSVKLHVTSERSGENSSRARHLLVATGRTPNTAGIGLDLAGVELTDRGYIKVDEHLRDDCSRCLGDRRLRRQSALHAHLLRRFSSDSETILPAVHRVTTGRQVPFCMFTDPELARIGLSETEAKAKGIAYRLAKIPMAAVCARARSPKPADS